MQIYIVILINFWDHFWFKNRFWRPGVWKICTSAWHRLDHCVITHSKDALTVGISTTTKKNSYFKRFNTYCFPADHRPCWICISPWRNTLSPCFPDRNSAADPAWAPPVAPWCCYTVLEFDRGFCSVPGTAEDSSVGVCSGSDPVSPRRAFFSHGRYPRWHKWTKMSSESRSWGAGQTVKPCPNASYCVHLVLCAACRTR